MHFSVNWIHTLQEHQMVLTIAIFQKVSDFNGGL